MSYPPPPGPDGSGAGGYPSGADNSPGAESHPAAGGFNNPPPYPGTDSYGNPTGYPAPGGYGSTPSYGPVESYWATGANPYAQPPDQPVSGYAAPGYPAPGYPAPGYPPPAAYGAPYQYLGQYQNLRPTDGMAIASLVVSCLGALSLCLYGIGGVVLGTVGAILGHVAKRRIRSSQAAGGGMALAGIIVGWIAAGLGLLIVGVIIVAIVMDANGNNF
jgi:hypothetical protein